MQSSQQASQIGFDYADEPLVALKPTREAGLQLLEQFLPKAGRLYQAHRNDDLGPTEHRNVSRLSPYLRRRLLSEQEVLAAVLSRHSNSDAFKFVQEVFWRTYWKGWLEHRPMLWQGYQEDLAEVHSLMQNNAWRMDSYTRAITGQTEIQPFNGWVQELIETGYLHNHARMWFASIWIFTLGLPWQLGADFFLRHLLDGDPAANTLGWRWVAGLHTKGKTYLASASNIRKCGAARVASECNHDAGLARLATSAQPPEETLSPRALQMQQVPWPAPYKAAGTDHSSVAVLLTEEDLALDLPLSPGGVVALRPLPRSVVEPTSPQVQQFGEAAVADALSRAKTAFASTLRAPCTLAASAEEIVSWAEQHGFTEILCAYAPSGPVRQLMPQLVSRLAARGIRLTEFMRDYDRLVWPHAQKGFFQLGKRIPDFLAAMELGDGSSS